MKWIWNVLIVSHEGDIDHISAHFDEMTITYHRTFTSYHRRFNHEHSVLQIFHGVAPICARLALHAVTASESKYRVASWASIFTPAYNAVLGLRCRNASQSEVPARRVGGPGGVSAMRRCFLQWLRCQRPREVSGRVGSPPRRA